MQEKKTALSHPPTDYLGWALIIVGAQAVQSELQKGLYELQPFPIAESSVATPTQVSAAWSSTVLLFYFLTI